MECKKSRVWALHRASGLISPSLDKIAYINGDPKGFRLFLYMKGL